MQRLTADLADFRNKMRLSDVNFSIRAMAINIIVNNVINNFISSLRIVTGS